MAFAVQVTSASAVHSSVRASVHPKGTSPIATYEGALVNINDVKSAIKLAPASEQHGTHCKVVPGSDYAIDGIAISRRLKQLFAQGLEGGQEAMALIRVGVGCMVNSSLPKDTPNCSFYFSKDMTCWVVTIKDIAKGEELLCKYKYQS